MIKKIILLLIIVLGFESQAQVGINTTAPKAQLEIKSTNEATPANTDGLLIPKINAFPVTNPTVDQQGMLVYLTTTVGANTPGFYFWDNPTVTWLPIGNNNSSDWKLTGNSGTNSGTNFIGTTDNQDLVFRRNNIVSGRLGINNTSFGLNALFSNTLGSFNTANGKSALQSNTIGTFNTANGFQALFSNTTGNNNTANGLNALALNTTGSSNTANGFQALSSNTLGNSNTANGFQALSNNTTGSSNTANGNSALSSNTTGNENTSLGILSDVAISNLINATAIGARAEVGASNSLVLGSVNGVNGATATVNVGIGTTTPLDRLHIVGNLRMTDGNEAAGKVLTSDANGTATWQNASANAWSLTGNSGTNSATNFIGTTDNTDLFFRRFNVASGRISTTNSSFGFSSLLSNTTGISNSAFGVSSLMSNTTGNSNSAFGQSSLLSNTTGFFNSAFGDSSLFSNTTGDSNSAFGHSTLRSNTTGSNNSAFGLSSLNLNTTGNLNSAFGIASLNSNTTGSNNSAFGESSLRSNTTGLSNSTFGSSSLFSNTIGNFNSAFGAASLNSNTTGEFNSAFGGSSLNSNTTGNFNSAFGTLSLNSNTTGLTNSAFGASSLISNITGSNNSAFGSLSLFSNTTGFFNSAFGSGSMFLNTTGNDNTAFGRFSLTTNTIGIQNTAIGSKSDVSLNNLTNATAIGANAQVGASNSMVLGSVNGVNGATATVNVGIGTTTPLERLHVAGKAFLTDGFSADNAALIYRNNTDYMFLGPQSGSSADGGALALFGSTNVSGGNAGGIDLNVPNAQVRMSHTNGSYAFRANSTSGYAASFEINDSGLEIGHNSASRALIFSPNSAERMRITPTGNVGIGTSTPARKFHVFNGTSGGTSNANAGFVLESSAIVYQHFLTPSANESGLLFGSNLASINGGIIFNNPLATNGIQFRAGGNANRMTITSAGDVGIGTTAPGGQFELSLDEGRKPTSNTWTIPSDARLKNVDGIYQKGLTEILQLKPIRYHYKNTDKKSFESKVLEKEAYGFLAQEVQQIFPEAVGTDADGYLNFDLHPILVAYTNAFKELDLKNQAAENKNRELELKLQSQEQIINNLIERLEKLEAKN